MNNFLIVFLFTGLGGCSRYALGRIGAISAADKGILLANIVACCVMGLLLAMPLQSNYIKLSCISFCGGLSTFSGYITYAQLSLSGVNSFWYHALSLGLGLAVFIISFYTTKSLVA